VLVANGAPVTGLTPVQTSPVPARRRHWLMAPVAMAAGFMAVVGVVVVTRGGQSDAGSAVMARAGAPGAAASAVMVRSAQLDRYLSAHRALASGAMPGAGSESRVYIVFEGQ
jgi:sigma-E factor negative regulatory protein RseA